MPINYYHGATPDHCRRAAGKRDVCGVVLGVDDSDSGGARAAL